MLTNLIQYYCNYTFKTSDAPKSRFNYYGIEYLKKSIFPNTTLFLLLPKSGDPSSSNGAEHRGSAACNHPIFVRQLPFCCTFRGIGAHGIRSAKKKKYKFHSVFRPDPESAADLSKSCIELYDTGTSSVSGASTNPHIIVQYICRYHNAIHVYAGLTATRWPEIMHEGTKSEKVFCIFVHIRTGWFYSAARSALPSEQWRSRDVLTEGMIRPHNYPPYYNDTAYVQNSCHCQFIFLLTVVQIIYNNYKY